MSDPSPRTVADLGERALIARIEAALPPPPGSVVVGIGDDAAVVEPERGALSVLTTDALVEGIHFDRAFTPAVDIGHKALAVNLSDIAAMGAAPRYALLSLAPPSTLPVDDLDALIEGIVALAGRHQTSLIGGNITRSSGPLFVEMTVYGSVRRRRVLTRNAARPGDAVYLSGAVGGAGAGLASFQGLSDSAEADRRLLDAVRQRYLRPQPRVKLGTLLGRQRVSRSCIDLSDGLADAAHQIAAASHVGIALDADAIPVQPEARKWWEMHGADPIGASLASGEDYELLFTVSPRAKRALAATARLVKDLPLTRIGEVTKRREVVLRRDGREEELPRGFEHLRERK